MPKKYSEQKRNADQILQGIRIVLPGTQALMGFQFISFFNPVFQNMEPYLKYLHFATLILTILCTILLIAPVAFQQIGEDGNVTDRFLKFTKKMLSTAMFLLLLAIVGDIYIAAMAIELNIFVSIVVSIVVFLTGISLWYGHSYIRRSEV